MQKCTDGFPKIPISKVGIRNIELPIKVYTKDSVASRSFSTIATISSYCDLVEGVKGINMSRISRTIFDIFKEPRGFILDMAEECVYALQKAHDTDDIYLKVKFKYPFIHNSPISKDLKSPEIVDVEIETTLVNNILKKYLTVDVVGMSLCPCSKEMSLLINNLTEEERTLFDVWDSNADDLWPTMKSLVSKLKKAGFGAHNQKSFVKIKVEVRDDIVWIEDLVNLVYRCTSAPTFSVLKRPDEKWVTEVSYMGGYYDDNKQFVEVPDAGPKFVEDISRQCAEKLNEMCAVKDYVVVVRNQESIHSGDIEAVAVLSAGKELR